jgi:hypothetical protein
MSKFDVVKRNEIMKNNLPTSQPSTGINVGRRLRQLRNEQGISIRSLSLLLLCSTDERDRPDEIHFM